MTRLLRSTPRVRLALSIALGLALPITAFAAGGGGGGGGSMGGMTSSSTPSRPKTPAEIAQSRYERGLKYRDSALGYEAKAAVADKSWFGRKPSEKAQDQWRKAVDAYQEAIESKADLYEAHSDLGFALRKLGDYERSLAAYDRALEIRSDYAPAIEYRGEAYLNLLRLDDAKQAYMRLFVLDRELAGQLMEHMQSWLSRSGDGPVEGLSAEELDTFRAWVSERAELASQAGGAVSDARSW